MDDLLARARAELYAVEPDEFLGLRVDLADAAKADGQAAVAKQIAALRKPTRAAWTLNQLSRAHPEAAGRLAELAADLQRGGDGPRLRELTQARSRLVDELTRQALAAAGVAAPPAALREDVLATLGAALADAEVAAALAEGTLVRAAHWAGFGLVPLEPAVAGPGKPAAQSPAQSPASAAARSPAKTAAKSSPSARPSPGPAAKPAGRSSAVRLAKGADEPADELADRRRQKKMGAEQAVAEATQAASSSAQAEQVLEDTVRDLEAQLEQARQELAQARRQSYRAETRRRRAVAELDRFRE